MTFAFIPQNLSIIAMRSSGYRDSAHALAELIDNAIQAGESIQEQTQIELICVDKAPIDGGRKRISKIGVFDNAVGMDPATLRKALQFGNGSHLDKREQKGIGKFGMGLPNSSISQCKRVEVWSWRNGEVYYTFLSVAEIEEGKRVEVPEPIRAELPSDWRSMIGNVIGKSGTLVVWSELDRIMWKQSSTLLANTAFIAGRVYRKYIHDKRVRIRLASYDQNESGLTPRINDFVKPNDPLYLMTGTNAPSPYDKDAAFVQYGIPKVLPVSFKGEEFLVTITASICKPKVRHEGGGRAIGKHTAKNQGISIVRAGRELELNHSFENSYDTRERWWGIQVEFTPELDDVFGVTNNKQAATNFMRYDLVEDAKVQDLSPAEYQNMLEADDDPRVPMYLISHAIERLLEALRKEIRQMKSIDNASSTAETPETIAERNGTTSVSARREVWGNPGKSDNQENDPPETRTEHVTRELEQDGIDQTSARKIASDYISKGSKFRFRHSDLAASNAFFDVSFVGGLIFVTFNTDSSVHPRLFAPMEEPDRVEDPYLQDILMLMMAWARMEDEASPAVLKWMREIRQEWGKIAVNLIENGMDSSPRSDGDQ